MAIQYSWSYTKHVFRNDRLSRMSYTAMEGDWSYWQYSLQWGEMERCVSWSRPRNDAC